MLRLAVWQRLDRRFGAGDRVLDIGCGTGADAVHLAERGVSVVAIDPSAPMLGLAARRAVAGGGSTAPRPCFVQGGAQDLARLAAEGQLGQSPFDGVLANFGVLNCLRAAELRRLAGALSGLLAPGAAWISVTMGPFCAWESVWYGLRGDRRRAFRRLSRTATADLGAGPVAVHYHSGRAIAEAARPWFEPVERAAIGALLPPTYAAGWLADRPRAVDRLARLERRLAGRAVMRAIADHALLTLERVRPMAGRGAP